MQAVMCRGLCCCSVHLRLARCCHQRAFKVQVVWTSLLSCCMLSLPKPVSWSSVYCCTNAISQTCVIVHWTALITGCLIACSTGVWRQISMGIDALDAPCSSLNRPGLSCLTRCSCSYYNYLLQESIEFDLRMITSRQGSCHSVDSPECK